MTMKPWLLAALLLLPACSDQDADNEGGATDPVALVELGSAQVKAVAQRTRLYGQVEIDGLNRRAVVAPVEAILVRIEAPAGSSVKAGDVLAHLALAPTSRIEISKVTNEVRAAKQALARAQRLRKTGLASDADVEAALAASKNADDTLAVLLAQSHALTLRAPATGQVVTFAASPGDLIPAGGRVVTLIEASTKRARFGLDPALVRALERGQTILIEHGDGADTFTSVISTIDPVVDPATHLASLYTTLPPDAALSPGQPLSARVTIRAARQATVVPYAALLDDGGQPFVFLVKDGVAHRRDVATGVSDGTIVAVTGDIQAGDQVVIAGGTALEDGMKVRTQ